MWIPVPINRFRKTKSDLFFTMPILLLGLRSFIEKVFKKRFPLWDSTPEAKEALWNMDTTIVTLLDPNGYYSDLSVVQAMPAAMHILQRTVYVSRPFPFCYYVFIRIMHHIHTSEPTS